MRRVNIRVSDELYSELIRRYGVRGLSRAVEELLREALFGEAAKTPSVQTAKTGSVLNVETPSVQAAETGSVQAAKAEAVPLSVGELAALLGDVESVALINGVPVTFGSEAERRGFIAYQLAAPRPDDSAWIVVKASFADYVLFTWTAGRKVSKEEVLEAAKRFVKRGLRRDVRKLAAEGEDEAALIALFVLTEKGMVDWSSGAPAPVIR